MRLSWPEFLDLLDSDPEEAFKLFYCFAYRLLKSIVPRPMRALSPDDQHDVFHEIVYHCVSQDFHVLRKYRDVGKPFGCWLYKVAHNLAVEYVHKYIQSKNRNWPFFSNSSDITNVHLIEKMYCNPSEMENRKQELSSVIRKVRSALKEVGSRCRLLLEMAADEFTPLEMVAVLGLPKDANAKISNDLRYCRRKLRDLLVTRDLKIEDFI